MKIWTSSHTFDHPWDTVVSAAWRKYPNPFNPAVEGTDVIDRRVGKDGVLRSHRLMTTRWGFPGWAQKMLGMSGLCYASEISEVSAQRRYMCVQSHNILGNDGTGYGSEHSEVDPKKKSMTLRARNLTFCDVITIDEKLVYSQHPQDKSKTQMSQEAVITVKGIPLSSYLESYVEDKISGNAKKGRDAMEFVIDKIKVEANDLQMGAKNTVNTIKVLNTDVRRPSV